MVDVSPNEVAVAHGRNLERAAIVAWLQEQAEKAYSAEGDFEAGMWSGLTNAADAIEKGAHLTYAPQAVARDGESDER